MRNNKAASKANVLCIVIGATLHAIYFAVICFCFLQTRKTVTHNTNTPVIKVPDTAVFIDEGVVNVDTHPEASTTDYNINSEESFDTTFVDNHVTADMLGDLGLTTSDEKWYKDTIVAGEFVVLVQPTPIDSYATKAKESTFYKENADGIERSIENLEYFTSFSETVYACSLYKSNTSLFFVCYENNGTTPIITEIR